jgi:hypothetical protein
LQHDDYYEAPKKQENSYYDAPKKTYYKEEKHDEVCDLQ